MSKVRVAAFSMSLDGFGAGPEQSLENPMGLRGLESFTWFFPTKTFQAMHGKGSEGTTGIDDSFAAKSFENLGAWVMGRNMFGPIRGPWPNDEWKGWWGDTPPYHVPVFVLTHYAREPLVMDGGTTFYFVTDGVESAIAQAKKAAGDKDVRIGGGVNTIRQALQAGLVDELHLALAPTLLGRGENLLGGIDMAALEFGTAEVTAGENATHFVIKKIGNAQE